MQAKFLNNTKIFAHGNMMITGEIMGSRILISGALNNEAGRITDSYLAARMGFNIKQVGTEMAEPSTIRMGVDDHICWIALELKEIETGIEQADERIKAIFQDQDAIMKEMETYGNRLRQLGQSETNRPSNPLTGKIPSSKNNRIKY